MDSETISSRAASALQQIRVFREARPFRPFTLVVEGGRSLLVEQPYCIAISPRGQEVVVAAPPTGAERVPLEKVTEVSVNAAA